VQKKLPPFAEEKIKEMTCSAFLPRSREAGGREEGGQFDFEPIRCAVEPVTAMQGRTANSALHL